MQTQERNRISDSIINQLQIKDSVMCNTIADNVNKAVLVNYDSIKILSKTLKDKLKVLGFETQHSVILNVIAKALGYQNHHSMKVNLEIDYSKDIPIVISENDSVLKRFFSIKNEFITKFNFDKTIITDYPDKQYIFQFIYDKDSLSTDEKAEIKRYLNSHGIKPYKNTIPLIKIPFSKILKIAFLVVKQYRNFFKPIWKENDNNLKNYDLSINEWPFLSYTDIKIKDAFLMVDSYSSDMPQHTIVNYLNYIFTYGTLNDIEFFEECIYNDNVSIKDDLLETQYAVRVHDWQKNNDLLTIVHNKKPKIKETLENIEVSISVMSYMQPLLNKIEIDNNRTMKDIIIDNCDYFYNNVGKYSKSQIIEKLYIDLLKKPKIDYVTEILNLDNEDEEIFMNYDITSRCMEKLAHTIYQLMESYNTVDNNLGGYTKILKRSYLENK